MNNNTTTAAELLALVREQNSTLPEVMLRRERELNETPPELVYEKLRVAYGIMRQAVEDSLREPGRTMGGLIGGEAIKLQKHREAGKNLCGGNGFPCHLLCHGRSGGQRLDGAHRGGTDGRGLRGAARGAHRPAAAV